ncbi:MAG: hypothetical protein OEM62_01560 [Acidobacteriota bacterium]|nr:hypothetical protein [Acidobacteriota bacterium]
MTRSAWRRFPKLWVPAAVVCVLNLGLLTAYRLVLAEEAELGLGLLDRRVEELEEVTQLRQQLEGLRATARVTEEGLTEFYRDRLSTEELMLTKIIAEVKSLARRAGLVPAAISYEKDSIERQNLVQRGLVFGVDGTYAQLRRLVNFLELSESFLTLDEVSLRGGDQVDGALAINLEISTLFAAKSLASEGRERGDDA